MQAEQKTKGERGGQREQQGKRKKRSELLVLHLLLVLDVLSEVLLLLSERLLLLEHDVPRVDGHHERLQRTSEEARKGSAHIESKGRRPP